MKRLCPRVMGDFGVIERGRRQVYNLSVDTRILLEGGNELIMQFV